MLLGCAASVAAAATAFDFGERLLESVGTEDEIPNGVITALAQGDDGYLWIGTQKGLVRFDGHRFRRFEHRVDTIEQRAVMAQRTLVAVEELGNPALAFVVGNVRESRRDHRACALRDVRTQLFQRHWRLAARGAHRVDRRDHVRRTVEQRPVEVEQHGLRVCHRVGCHQAASGFDAQAR